jgi:hypothetical protein
MSNVAHVTASFYLRIETDLSEKEYNNKFNKETLAASNIQLILADGSVHRVSLADLLDFKTEEFEENKKPLGEPSDHHRPTAPTTMLSRQS